MKGRQGATNGDAPEGLVCVGVNVSQRCKTSQAHRVVAASGTRRPNAPLPVLAVPNDEGEVGPGSRGEGRMEETLGHNELLGLLQSRGRVGVGRVLRGWRAVAKEGVGRRVEAERRRGERTMRRAFDSWRSVACSSVGQGDRAEGLVVESTLRRARALERRVFCAWRAVVQLGREEVRAGERQQERQAKADRLLQVLAESSKRVAVVRGPISSASKPSPRAALSQPVCPGRASVLQEASSPRDTWDDYQYRRREEAELRTRLRAAEEKRKHQERVLLATLSDVQQRLEKALIKDVGHLALSCPPPRSALTFHTTQKATEDKRREALTESLCSVAREARTVALKRLTLRTLSKAVRSSLAAQEAAEKRACARLKRLALSAWQEGAASSLREKDEAAARAHDTRLQRVAFGALVSARLAREAEMIRAVSWRRRTLKCLCIGAWANEAKRSSSDRLARQEAAAQSASARTKRRLLRSWHSVAAESREARERAAKRDRLKSLALSMISEMDAK